MPWLVPFYPCSGKEAMEKQVQLAEKAQGHLLDMGLGAWQAN